MMPFCTTVGGGIQDTNILSGESESTNSCVGAPDGAVRIRKL